MYVQVLYKILSWQFSIYSSECSLETCWSNMPFLDIIHDLTFYCSFLLLEQPLYYDSLHNASLEANWSWPHAATFNFTPRSFALARGSLLCRGEATLPGGFNHWIGSVLHRGCRACWTTSQRGALKLQWGNVTLACKSFAPHTCFFFLIWRLAFSRPPPSLAHQLRLCQLFSRSLAPPTWSTGCKSTHRPCWSRATHRLHWKSICTSYWAFWGSPACPSCRCAPPLR